LMRTASLFVTAPACTNHCCLIKPIVYSDPASTAGSRDLAGPC
jgi:hypothetical protein